LKNKNVFRVDSFKEKPDLKTAMAYIKQDDYFWNSGIFVWSVSTIVNALRIYAPEINGVFEPLADVYGTEREQDIINEEFPKCPNISVDYAILEKANEIFVYPADFGWSDVGTWGSLKTMLVNDMDGNAVVGNNVSLYETKNCIIHTIGEKKVVVQGMNDCIIAENNNTLLICKLKEEQRIKLFSGE
jgi:mannose-1-phosphate guanylyltransferase